MDLTPAKSVSFKSLRQWSRDILVCTDGSPLEGEQLNFLKEHGLEVKTEKITHLQGVNGQLQEIVFEDQEQSKREAIFFNSPSFIRSKVLDQLGCRYNEENGAEAFDFERTGVPGVFVAGNILRDVQLVIVAASDGAQAAFGINKYLNKIAPL